jgi:hypothetical protein
MSLEKLGLKKDLVYQGGFTMVYVGNNGYITDISHATKK